MRYPKLKLFTLCILIMISLQFSPATFSSPSRDNVLITEVLYDAPVNEPEEEWFELFNPTDSAINLTGWTVEDNYVNFSLSGTIPARGYFVVSANATYFYNLYGYNPDFVGNWGSFALSNSGDELTLYDDLSNEVDFVAWDVTGWSIATGNGISIQRTNLVDTDTVADWEVTGTTGDPGDGPYDEMLLDETAPIVDIIAPVNDSAVSGFVSIEVDASDENGIARYEIYVDGGLIATTSTYVWDSRNVKNGSHIISAICKDPASNVGQDNISVIVANEELITSFDDIKIMEYNIENSGADPEWKEVVKEENPDIVVFVETGYWDDGADALLDTYTNEFNAYFVNEEPYESYTAQNVPYGTSGEAIMSRFPILESVQIPEVPLDNGTLYEVTHDFMFWNVNISGTEVYIIGAHLKAMEGAVNEARREYEQEGIINYMDGLGEHPIIYMGDLNSFSPEDTGDLAPPYDNLGYGPLTMMLEPDDPTYGQYSSEVHNFIDVYRTLNPTTPGYTYPSYQSRIDFIIVNEYFEGYLINSTVGDTASANIASDHYSLDFFLDTHAFVNELDIPPVQVQGLNAEAVSQTTISLSWSANYESDLAYYRVFRNNVNIVNTSNTFLTDGELTPNTWYNYKVTAVDTNGNEGIPSNTVSVKTLDVTTESTDFGMIVLILGGVIFLGLSTFIKRRKEK